MSAIKIHVMHTGRVCVSPYLPFGGEGCNIFKAAGLTTRSADRLWLPVSAYLIEHPRGLLLYDCGWDRSMSPDGTFDRRAQVASLGSRLLYLTNQGVVEPGAAVSEQLAARGIAPEDLDCVLVSHLDCDHVNGLAQVRGAKRVLVAADELAAARGGRSFVDRVRFQPRWWQGVDLETFNWNGTEGPVGKSFDLFGDGSALMVNIPGHSAGQCAFKLTGADGRFALLVADGGYAARSWREMVLPGISQDRGLQRASLAWIREQSMDPRCVATIANHDPDVAPSSIEF